MARMVNAEKNVLISMRKQRSISLQWNILIRNSQVLAFIWDSTVATTGLATEKLDTGLTYQDIIYKIASKQLLLFKL